MTMAVTNQARYEIISTCTWYCLFSSGINIPNCNYVGEGYGIPTEGCLEAIRMFAELEGLLLDPVYSAKAAAGLIDLIRNGKFSAGQRVLFWHTGGAVALFGYDKALTA